MPRLKNLIKTFTFEEIDRDGITLGPNVRLDPKASTIKLVATGGFYPLTANLFVRTRLTNPSSLAGLLGFEADTLNWLNEDNEPVTFVRYRLSNGVNDFWWDGTAWDNAPAAGEWNTDIEISTHIATFPMLASRAFQVIANLRTTSPRFTPSLRTIKVLFSSNIEFDEDIIFRSLVPTIRAGVRPIARALFTTGASPTSTIPVSGLGLETGYRIVGIDSVFNDTLDPTHFIDVFNTFNGTNITLDAPVAAGTTMFVNFTYEPLVAVNTSQDYVEADRVPAIILNDIRVTSAPPSPQALDSVSNRGTNNAVVVRPPLVATISATVVAMAEKQVDLRRIQDEFIRFIRNAKTLRSTGMDERYTMRLIDEFSMFGEPEQQEIHMSQATIVIEHVPYWLEDSYTDQIVQNIVFEMNPLTAGAGPSVDQVDSDQPIISEDAVSKTGSTDQSVGRHLRIEIETAGGESSPLD